MSSLTYEDHRAIDKMTIAMIHDLGHEVNYHICGYTYVGIDIQLEIFGRIEAAKRALKAMQERRQQVASFADARKNAVVEEQFFLNGVAAYRKFVEHFFHSPLKPSYIEISHDFIRYSCPMTLHVSRHKLHLRKSESWGAAYVLRHFHDLEVSTAESKEYSGEYPNMLLDVFDSAHAMTTLYRVDSVEVDEDHATIFGVGNMVVYRYNSHSRELPSGCFRPEEHVEYRDYTDPDETYAVLDFKGKSAADYCTGYGVRSYGGPE